MYEMVLIKEKIYQVGDLVDFIDYLSFFSKPDEPSE